MTKKSLVFLTILSIFAFTKLAYSSLPGITNSSIGADTTKVLKAGDTMTGQLNMSNSPIVQSGVNGYVTSSSSGNFNALFGDGNNVTNLKASNVSNGILGSGVIASSIAVNGVYSGAIQSEESSCSKVSGGDITCTGGKVGISTDTPASSLHIYNTTDNHVLTLESTNSSSVSMEHLKNLSAQGPFQDYWSANSRWAFGIGSAGNFNIRNSAVGVDPVNGTTLFEMTPGGFLGIGGVALPDANLDVMSTDGPNDFVLTISSQDNTHAILDVYGDGTVAIGTSSKHAEKLYVNGDLTVNGSSVNATSFWGDASHMTGVSVTAPNIGAGVLPTNVIASSIAVNSVWTGAIQPLAVVDAKVNDVAWTKLTGTPTISISTFLYTSGTLFTTPANTFALEYEMCGGGGGSGGSGTNCNAGGVCDGTSGGTSYFGVGLSSATGGAGGVYGNSVTAGGTCQGTYDMCVDGGSSAATNGGSGTNYGCRGGSSLLGIGGVEGDVNNVGRTGTGYGAGASGSNRSSTYVGVCGSGGGCLRGTINSPAASYVFHIGTAGNAGAAGTSGAAGAAGTTGVLRIKTWHN